LPEPIIDIPEFYRPQVDDLPGDLRRIAAAIDDYIPGEGVRLTLLLAQIFPGQHIYIRNARVYLRAIRDDGIRAEYDLGGITSKELATKYRLCLRQIEKILARPSSQAELEEKQMSLF